MKIMLKSAKLFIWLVIIILILLISAAYFLEEKAGNAVLKSINKNTSAKIQIGSLHLSFIRRFPKASVELKNVIVHPSADFNSRAFRNCDTLLKAESVFMEFRITDVIRGNYTISSITADHVYANLFVDSAYHASYDIFPESNSTNTLIDLDKINLEDAVINYRNLPSQITLNGVISNGILRTRISGTMLNFSAETEMKIHSLSANDIQLLYNADLFINIALNSNESGITFNESKIETGNSSIFFKGQISSENFYDLVFSADHLELSDIKKCLPEKLSGALVEYHPEGALKASAKISGFLSQIENPHIEAFMSLTDGRLRYGKNGIEFKNICFTSSINNGPSNNIKSCSATFNDLKFSISTSDYSGKLVIKNFTHPLEEIYLKGIINPSEIKKLFDLEEITSASGSAEFELKLETDFQPGDSLSVRYLASLKPEAMITFKSFSIGTKKNNFYVTEVNGNLHISEVYEATNLSLVYNDQNITINAKARNVPEWLSGQSTPLVASGEVAFDRFVPGAFINRNEETKESVIIFPKNLFLDLRFAVDSLKEKQFTAGNMTGRLNYKPGQLTFNSVRFKAFEGSISGDGFIVQNASHSFITRADLEIHDININKAFTSFSNFGQEFIKAENLSGDLSGSTSVIIPMDQHFKPRQKSVSAEGKFIITDGALINFEPVTRLSSFIEMSELQNIHFQKLENDFFIRNNVLFIPQMDVRSSAADLTVNGRHSFDNDYEYHVKMLLSQILSRKRRSTRNNVTEFGVVQDDGLGRTSLLLKIEDKGDDVKVGYDLKAAATVIRSSIQSEKQSLKTILNEEYGWYKDDTQVKKTQPGTKKPRFTVTWEENDSSTVENQEDK